MKQGYGILRRRQAVFEGTVEEPSAVKLQNHISGQWDVKTEVTHSLMQLAARLGSLLQERKLLMSTAGRYRSPLLLPFLKGGALVYCTLARPTSWSVVV